MRALFFHGYESLKFIPWEEAPKRFRDTLGIFEKEPL